MGSWVHLPKDLLESISDSCILPDYIRLQCVCRSWRSILKNRRGRRELPWLMIMLPPKDSNKEDPDDSRLQFYSPSENKIITVNLPELRGKRCFGSFGNGWLMTVDNKMNMRLFHPWSRTQLKLPHQSTLVEPRYRKGLRSDSWDVYIRKVAVSDDHKVLVAVYGDIGHLAFCRIGDRSWTRFNSVYRFMGDVIYHRGKFYVLNKVRGVYGLRIEDGVFLPHLKRLTNDLNIPFSYLAKDLYLVPNLLTDEMFVIAGSSWNTNIFDIYKTLSRPCVRKITEVDSLDDQILFLGYNSPMVFMATEFPGFKGNHIYFADHNGHSCVFNVKDGTVKLLLLNRHSIFESHIWIAAPEEPHGVST